MADLQQRTITIFGQNCVICTDACQEKLAFQEISGHFKTFQKLDAKKLQGK